jgi:3-hydroxypropanoate dehydrogenase
VQTGADVEHSGAGGATVGPVSVEAVAEETTVHAGAVQDAAPLVAADVVAPVTTVTEAGLDVLFRTARTVCGWTAGAVSDELLRQMYNLLKLGLSAGNVEKALAAPVVCIVAHDPRFYDDLPRLYPGVDARTWFVGNDTLASETAFRNGTLQGAYLIMAARAVGLDCAPMSGFDCETVDREFLVAQGWKSNFLVALGHGDRTGLPERAPRLTFDEACRLL